MKETFFLDKFPSEEDSRVFFNNLNNEEIKEIGIKLAKTNNVPEWAISVSAKKEALNQIAAYAGLVFMGFPEACTSIYSVNLIDPIGVNKEALDKICDFSEYIEAVRDHQIFKTTGKRQSALTLVEVVLYSKFETEGSGPFGRYTIETNNKDLILDMKKCKSILELEGMLEERTEEFNHVNRFVLSPCHQERVIIDERT